jgi:hypothetical protein
MGVASGAFAFIGIAKLKRGNPLKIAVRASVGDALRMRLPFRSLAPALTKPFLAPRVCAATLAAIFALALGPKNSAAASWEATSWHGEKGWKASSGATLAIVSETRSRLIYLGASDEKSNLLSAPAERGELIRGKPSPNWGGHRVWLGPQSRWGWPPPRDWEFSATASAEIKGDRLILEDRHEDAAYPAILREYVWEGNRLRCTARWKPAPHDRPYYAMHVVPIDVPAAIDVSLFKWERVPLGVVGIHGDQPDAAHALPVASVTVNASGDRATVASGIVTSKLGFRPQTLQVKRGAWLLMVRPGPTHGVELESPDFGYISQIWVGDSHATFCELEQITPYLIPADDGWCASTIYLEAAKE